MKSNYLSLNQKNWIKGLVIAIFGAFMTALIDFCTTSGFDISKIDWKLMIGGAVVAGASYIKVTLFSNSNGDLYKPEQKNETPTN